MAVAAAAPLALPRRLKLRHLQVLVALDDQQHLGRVAELLHTSQPALSRTLSEIEDLVGERLFSRTARGTFALPAGEVLIRHARHALQVLANAGEEIGILREGLSGRLRIGTNYSSAAYLLPQALIRLTAEAPTLRIVVREATLDALLPELLGHRLDVIVARLDRRISREGLQFARLFDEPMALVVGKAHPLARARKPRWADLKRYSWVLPPEDNPVRDGLDALFLRHGLHGVVARIECGSILVNSVLLNGTQAISVLPASVATHYSRLGILHRLPLPLPQVFGPVGLITTGRDAQPAALSIFRRCVESCL